MKKSWKTVVVLLLCAGISLSFSACGQSVSSSVPMPAVWRGEGTRDLMMEAIDLSGYAGTGLSDFVPFGYGAGIFSEYLAIQRDPLTAASYPLKVQAAARKVDADGRALPDFSRFVLEETGFLLEDFAKYTPTDDLTAAWNALFEAAGESPTALPTGIARAAQKPLARWLSAAATAYTMITDQTKGLTKAQFATFATFAYANCAGAEAAVPIERMRAVAEKVDLNELLKAGQLMTEATARLMAELDGVGKLTDNDRPLTAKTPLGDFVLGTTGADTYSSPEALLLVDPAGDDTYDGRIAVSRSLNNPLSVAIDLAGNDTYRSHGFASQGCGILGVGLLFDRRGEDTYYATRMAQGATIFGTGMLFDGEGSDHYTCLTTGQAAGFFGLAVLADTRGDDIYDGYAYLQSSAGHRAVTYLLDREGDDRYEVEKLPPEGYGGLDYGSCAPGRTSNFSQGCGWGQRAVQTDERGAAGGIAGLLDFGGNDRYSGSMWLQGTGYWSGIGFLYDESGDDTYEAFHYSQAAVAHYGVGMTLDLGGNDSFKLEQAGGMGYVWDRGLSMFINDGGNDMYSCSDFFGGVANTAYGYEGCENTDKSYAFFIETAGNDGYVGSSTARFGNGLGGYFLDADGKDIYQGNFRNDSVKTDPVQKNGVFLDAVCKDGEVPYIAFWEKAKETYGYLPIE